MNFVLLSPHVENALQQVTTPDIIVDQLFVFSGNRLQQRPAGHLSHTGWIELSAPFQCKTAAAVLLIAAGAGTLLSPAFLVDQGSISVSRSAWRLDQVDEWAAELGSESIPEPVTLTMPASLESILAEAPGATQNTLPRGTAVLCVLTPEDPRENGTSWAPELTLKDAALNRVLTHRLHLSELSPKQADKAILPRYSVGPQLEPVTHYV